MLRDKEGFERATGDEAIGAVAALIVTAAVEGCAFSVVSGTYFTDMSQAGEANVGQPSKDTPAPSVHFSTAESVGAATLPVLGAALGAVVVSRLRGRSFRRATRRQAIDEGLEALQHYANTN